MARVKISIDANDIEKLLKGGTLSLPSGSYIHGIEDSEERKSLLDILKTQVVDLKHELIEKNQTIEKLNNELDERNTEIARAHLRVEDAQKHLENFRTEAIEKVKKAEAHWMGQKSKMLEDLSKYDPTDVVELNNVISILSSNKEFADKLDFSVKVVQDVLLEAKPELIKSFKYAFRRLARLLLDEALILEESKEDEDDEEVQHP